MGIYDAASDEIVEGFIGVVEGKKTGVAMRDCSVVREVLQVFFFSFFLIRMLLNSCSRTS